MSISSDTHSIAVAKYNDEYFAWQDKDASLGARINSVFFDDFVTHETRVVLDFGCGGGHLLKTLKVDEPLGVEVNPAARRVAQAQGIPCVTDMAAIASQSIDLIISSHAIEHVEHPAAVFAEFRRALKPGSLLVVLIPCDRSGQAFIPNDQDFHLYSWSPSNIGNLAISAGFEVIEAKKIYHKFGPGFVRLSTIAPLPLIHVLSSLWDRLGIWRLSKRSRHQVRLVARKPV